MSPPPTQRADAPPVTPSTSRRKSTLKDRTPRQVQQLLSARKLQQTQKSSAKKPSDRRRTTLLGGAGTNMNHTPANLLRALSRMPDLPPPTPDEEPAPNLDGTFDNRRDSIVSRPSLGGGSTDLHQLVELDDDDSQEEPEAIPEEEEEEDSSSQADQPSVPIAATSSRQAPSLFSSTSKSVSQSIKKRNPLSSATRIALSLLPPMPKFPPARKPNFNPSQEPTPAIDDEEEEEGGYEDEEARIDKRRYSTASSVEAARRRASGVTSLGGGDDSFLREGEEGDEADDEEGSSARRGKVSLGGSEVFGGRPSLGSPSARSIALSGRYSTGSVGFGSIGGDDVLAFDDSIEEEQPESVGKLLFHPPSEQVEDDGFVMPEGGEGFEEDQEAYEEEDENGARIPWADKGKGRAIEPDEEDEEAQIGQSGDEDDDDNQFEEFDNQQEEDEVAAMVAAQNPRSSLPPAPALSALALARKKRQGLVQNPAKRAKKKRTQRYTPTGDPVPDLPSSRQKALFEHFLGPGVKLDPDGVEALMDASQEFFEQLMKDASAFAQHAGRQSLVHESDIVMMLHRQRLLTPALGLSTLGRRLGLDREVQSVLETVGNDGLGATTAGKGPKKRKRVARVDEGAGKRRRKSA